MLERAQNNGLAGGGAAAFLEGFSVVKGDDDYHQHLQLCTHSPVICL